MQTISLIKKRKGEPVKSLEHLDHTHTHTRLMLPNQLKRCSRLPFGSQTGAATLEIQPRLANFKSTHKATVNTACCTGGPLLALNYSSVIPQGL